LDQHAVVRAHEVGGLRNGHTVAAYELPIRAPAEHGSMDRRARERAFEDRDHPPQAFRGLAHDDHLPERGIETERKLEIGFQQRHPQILGAISSRPS
jgi:hypothetical protein